MKKMKKKFKVGDRVLLSPNSLYYNLNTSANPRNVIGIIQSVSRDTTIIVTWNNSKSNVYSYYDLELLPIIEEDGDYEK